MPTLNWTTPRVRPVDARPAAHVRGYGRRWQKVRLWFLRHHPMCMWPGGCDRAAVHVHHITPLAGGGTNGEENLQALCRPHHDAAHKTRGG